MLGWSKAQRDLKVINIHKTGTHYESSAQELGQSEGSDKAALPSLTGSWQNEVLADQERKASTAHISATYPPVSFREHC